jgi:hypothetical protein
MPPLIVDADDAARYVGMPERTGQAAIATLRAHRDSLATKAPDKG